METFVLDSDRTLFSELAVEFENWIVTILSQTSIPGIPPEMMAKFQLGYADSAFRCRFPFCDSSSYGFATAALRRQHESSHLTLIYCSATSCPWSRIGFKDQNALRNHVRVHHSKDMQRLAPAKARILSPIAADSIRKKNRSELADEWPPVFSYVRKEGAGSLAEKYLDKVSPKYVRQGEDWFAFFEPHQPRLLDIEMAHTLPHSSVVSCVGFSLCGSYIATGSNRLISLYRVTNGIKMSDCHVDIGSSDIKECYVRDLCFHPDSSKVIGVCEDKNVRVRQCSSN